MYDGSMIKHALLLRTDITTVRCSFINSPSALYTFICPKEFNLQIGDLAVVKLNSEKYSVVQIEEIDLEPIINVDANFEYAWIFGVIDPSITEKLIQTTEILGEKISHYKNRTTRKQIIEALGMAEMDINSILGITHNPTTPTKDKE